MFNDKEVIARVLTGDMKAFAVLVNQYQRLVFTVVHRLIPVKEDVEDVCQEVFIKVHKNLKSFRFESKLSTWLARIAYLTAINHLKKYNRPHSALYAEDVDAFNFTQETPDMLIEQKNTAAYLEKLINAMPAGYKIVVTLYHMHGFTYPEITAATGMPEGTVKGYLHRARKLLKEKIDSDVKNTLYE